MVQAKKSPRVAGMEDGMSSKTKALLQISLRNNGKLRVTFATYGKEGINSNSGEMTWDQVEKLLPNVMPAGVRALKAAQRHQAACAQAPGLHLDRAVPSSSQAQCKRLPESDDRTALAQPAFEAKEHQPVEWGNPVEISIGSPVEPSFLGLAKDCLSSSRRLAHLIGRLIAHPIRSLFSQIARLSTSLT